MSHPSSPNNRNSLFGWAKSLKRGHLLSSESVNEISDDESLSKSPSKSWAFQQPSNQNAQLISPRQQHAQLNQQHDLHQTQSHPIQVLHSQQSNNPVYATSPPTNSSTAGDFLRPLLNHKSRSSNNVNRVRSNSLNQSEHSLRQHRDSFLQHNPLVDENSKYFGVPLEQALQEASAKISILDDAEGIDQQLSQYGQIPIVVAKCGVFLKKNGLTTEGIFRVGGSSKRLKELQAIFNTPPNYGKKLNWEGYNVHDAASMLRRYLNALPEPLVPLEMYETFREPLRSRPRIVSYMKYKAENPSKSLQSSSSVNIESSSDVLDSSQLLTEANIGRLNNGDTKEEIECLKKPASVSSSNNVSSADLTQSQQNVEQEQGQGPDGDKKPKKKSKNYKKLAKDVYSAIEEYSKLISELPLASRQLLFYVLDLLAMVQNHADENLMSSRNLAAIFQPSILSHPSHDLDPIEYALSQLVVEFLIQYAYKLLPKHRSKDNEEPLTSSTQSPHPVLAGASSKTEEPVEQDDRQQPQTIENDLKTDDLPENVNNHGFQHNVTIPFDTEDDFELSDEPNDIGSDFDELHFQQLHLNHQNVQSTPPPPIVISTPSSLV